MNFTDVFLILVIWIPLIAMGIFALVDLFRRRDIHGWAKALWLLGIIWLPIIGVVAYFVTKPRSAEDIAYMEGRDDFITQGARIRERGYEHPE